MKKLVAFFVLCIMAVSLHAQLKPLTDDQYFKNNFKGIVQPLPTVGKWINDNQLLLTRDGKKLVVDCKTGKEREATDADNVPTDKPISIPTISNRNNDLFVKIDGKDVQLTNDK
ncbi:MAG: hypothetical protein ACOYKE_13545, partial [Ferruginibacter sp.]